MDCSTGHPNPESSQGCIAANPQNLTHGIRISLESAIAPRQDEGARGSQAQSRCGTGEIGSEGDDLAIGVQTEILARRRAKPAGIVRGVVGAPLQRAAGEADRASGAEGVGVGQRECSGIDLDATCEAVAAGKRQGVGPDLDKTHRFGAVVAEVSREGTGAKRRVEANERAGSDGRRVVRDKSGEGAVADRVSKSQSGSGDNCIAAAGGVAERKDAGVHRCRPGVAAVRTGHQHRAGTGLGEIADAGLRHGSGNCQSLGRAVVGQREIVSDRKTRGYGVARTLRSLHDACSRAIVVQRKAPRSRRQSVSVAGIGVANIQGAQRDRGVESDHHIRGDVRGEIGGVTRCAAGYDAGLPLRGIAPVCGGRAGIDPSAAGGQG